MMLTAPDLVAFWLTPWSEPFRAACHWFTLETQPLRGKQPDSKAPTWLRLLFLQRWVGQAVAERLRLYPLSALYRFGEESDPCWTPDAWASYERRWLRGHSDEQLLWRLGLEVERLLRIAQEHPMLVGDGDWTGAALGVAAHLAHIYSELKRRHRAMPARAMLRAELCRFVEWPATASGAEAGD